MGRSRLNVDFQALRDQLRALARGRLTPGVEALCCTLFESAKLAGADRHAYELEATRRAIA